MSEAVTMPHTYTPHHTHTHTHKHTHTHTHTHTVSVISGRNTIHLISNRSLFTVPEMSQSVAERFCKKRSRMNRSDKNE